MGKLIFDHRPVVDKFRADLVIVRSADWISTAVERYYRGDSYLLVSVKPDMLHSVFRDSTRLRVPYRGTISCYWKRVGQVYHLFGGPEETEVSVNFPVHTLAEYPEISLDVASELLDCIGMNSDSLLVDVNCLGDGVLIAAKYSGASYLAINSGVCSQREFQRQVRELWNK